MNQSGFSLLFFLCCLQRTTDVFAKDIPIQNTVPADSDFLIFIRSPFEA